MRADTDDAARGDDVGCSVVGDMSSITVVLADLWFSDIGHFSAIGQCHVITDTAAEGGGSQEEGEKGPWVGVRAGRAWGTEMRFIVLITSFVLIHKL